MTFLLYLCMLAFDAAVVIGFAYLVQVRRWSPWWILLALVLIAGSDPTKLIALSMKCDASNASTASPR